MPLKTRTYFHNLFFVCSLFPHYLLQANVSSATGGNTRKNSDYCDIDDSSRIALSNERTDKVDSVTARTEMVLLPCYYEYALREMHAYEKDNCKRNCKQNTMDYERNLKQYSEPSTTWMICLQHREKLGDLLADLVRALCHAKGNIVIILSKFFSIYLNFNVCVYICVS